MLSLHSFADSSFFRSVVGGWIGFGHSGATRLGRGAATVVGSEGLKLGAVISVFGGMNDVVVNLGDHVTRRTGGFGEVGGGLAAICLVSPGCCRGIGGGISVFGLVFVTVPDTSLKSAIVSAISFVSCASGVSEDLTLDFSGSVSRDSSFGRRGLISTKVGG